MKKSSEWYAFVQENGRVVDAERITIERTRFSDCRFHDRCTCDPWIYCTVRRNGVGIWPGVGSVEWIEYIPPEEPT